MAVPGTENGIAPFFSPDRRWLAFDRDGELMKVSFVGGPAIKLCDAPGTAVGVWAEDDTIYFSSGTARVLQRVPASGGTPEAITTLRPEEGEISHATPALLPGGRSLLFTIFRKDGAKVARLDLDTGVVTSLLDGKQPYYLASGPGATGGGTSGHLVFARRGALWVAPFNGQRGTVTGPETPAVSSVLDMGGTNGGAQFALAPTGVLLYAPTQRTVSARALLWYDRDGIETALPLEPRGISHLALSPDGTRVALSVGTGTEHDIWTYDLRRETLTRVTTHPEVDFVPVWSPDGRSIAFRSHRDGGGLFLQPVDPPRDARRLTTPNGPQHTPWDFTPDGRAVLFTEFRSFGDQDIGMVDVATGAITWLLDERAAEMRPRLSPDGRWLAYSADTSGRQSPQWSRDGRELWFDAGSALHVADVSEVDGVFQASAPRAVMAAASMYRDRLGPSYDVAPDGRVLTSSVDRQPRDMATPLMLLEGWLRGHI